MNYWIFTVTQKKVNGKVINPDEILKQRINDKFWGLGEKTPNRKNLKKGDKVYFYVGIPFASFSASATISSDQFQLSNRQKIDLSHGMDIYTTEYGVFLDDIEVWETPILVKNIVQSLSFIENKYNWGAYFQGGVRQISEEDFFLIQVDTTRSKDRGFFKEDIVSESQFALESHLEEFMSINWNKIRFDSHLERYQIDERDGRQYPAGPWSIDFLCIDKRTNDFVVIELKRGKTSDATVGQVLRYMGWVKENMANKDQNVRGIIICQEIDDALKYAIKPLPNVTVMTYKVDFQLSLIQSK